MSEHRKNHIFRDNNCFVNMSVILLVRYQIFVDELAQNVTFNKYLIKSLKYGIYAHLKPN